MAEVDSTFGQYLRALDFGLVMRLEGLCVPLMHEQFHFVHLQGTYGVSNLLGCISDETGVKIQAISFCTILFDLAVSSMLHSLPQISSPRPMHKNTAQESRQSFPKPLAITVPLLTCFYGVAFLPI